MTYYFKMYKPSTDAKWKRFVLLLGESVLFFLLPAFTDKPFDDIFDEVVILEIEWYCQSCC